jgi:hypothetical protein
MGNPISHSTHCGFSFPPAFVASVSEFLESSAGDFPLSFQSLAVGVGHITTASLSVGDDVLHRTSFLDVLICPLSTLLGVGHQPPFCSGPLISCGRPIANDEHSVAYVRGTNGGSRYAIPFRVKPDLGQRPKNSVQPSSKQRCHVLQHNNSRLQFSNQANGFEKQSRSFAIKSCPKSGVGNILTGESSANNVDSFKVVLSAFSNVSFSMDAWPVLGEHSVGVVVNLNLPFASHSSSFETKIKSADACE